MRWVNNPVTGKFMSRFKEPLGPGNRKFRELLDQLQISYKPLRNQEELGVAQTTWSTYLI